MPQTAAYRWGGARYKSREGTSHKTLFILGIRIQAWEMSTLVSSGFEVRLTSVLLLAFQRAFYVLVGLCDFAGWFLRKTPP